MSTIFSNLKTTKVISNRGFFYACVLLAGRYISIIAPKCVCFILYASGKQNRLKKWRVPICLFSFSIYDLSLLFVCLFLVRFLMWDSILYVMGFFFFFPPFILCVHWPSYLDFMKRCGNLNLYLDVLPPIVYFKLIC